MTTAALSNPALTRRALFVAAAQVGTAIAAYAATPRASTTTTGTGTGTAKLEDVIPKTIGDWHFASSAGIITSTEELDTEGYDQLLKRSYEAPGQPLIMLLIAFGNTQGGSLQLHRPETCYPGQGFGLSAFREHDLDLKAGQPVHARSFTAARDDRTERLLYWTRIGSEFPRTTLEEYHAILASVISGVVPDGILVRVSTLETDIAAADRAIERFTAALAAAAPPAGKALLIGA